MFYYIKEYKEINLQVLNISFFVTILFCFYIFLSCIFILISLTLIFFIPKEKAFDY